MILRTTKELEKPVKSVSERDIGLGMRLLERPSRSSDSVEAMIFTPARYKTFRAEWEKAQSEIESSLIG